jgi:hypothetical protein
VYVQEGTTIHERPEFLSPVLSNISFGTTVSLESLDAVNEKEYLWYPVQTKGKIGYISNKSISRYPLPNAQETIEDYALKLTKECSETKYEIYQWDDRIEHKFLFENATMREVFLLADRLYPIDFEFPKCSSQFEMEETQLKILEPEDIIEEFEVTRNNNGDIIMIEYVADFGESHDSVVMHLRTDGSILLTIGNYNEPAADEDDGDLDDI